MLNKLESLADAIAFFNRAYDPQSEAYKARNPGLLPAISPRHAKTKTNRRQFLAYTDGYQALLFDLKLKCSDKTKARFKDGPHTLESLMQVMGHTGAAAKPVAKFLQKALDADVQPSTLIKWFIEE